LATGDTDAGPGGEELLEPAQDLGKGGNGPPFLWRSRRAGFMGG